MGNCTTQKQLIGQPSNLGSKQSSSKSSIIQPQFYVCLPEKMCKAEKAAQQGLMSRVTQDLSASQSYNEYKKINKNTAEKYTDKQFRHDKKSIGQNITTVLQWRRPLQFLKQQPVLGTFNCQIQTADLKQGKINNSYFVSAFATLAQNQQYFWEIIKSILDGNAHLSTNGAYAVWLFVDGKWQCTVIDDAFPTAYGVYSFSKYNKQLWPLIIEKAYAKIFKSYHAIQKGILGNCLNALTGAPCQYLCKNSQKLITSQKAWQIIRQAQIQKHLISASTECVDVNAYFQRQSVFSYPVVETQQVYVLTQTSKKLQRILKLNNAWGKYQWKGRWSEYSDVWSQQLRHQLGYQKADESVIWISIQDLLKNFGQVCICKYNPEYINISKEITIQQKQIKGVFMNIQQKSQGYLNLYQKDYRHHIKTYQYSQTRLILLQVNKQTKKISKIIKQTTDCDYCSITQFILQPGLYYVLFQVDWTCNYTRDITINVYSENPIGLQIDQTQLNNDTIFYQSMKLHLLQDNSSVQIYTYPQDSDITRTTGQFGGYIFYHYKNNSQKHCVLSENFILGDSKNLQICDSKNKNETNLCVKPGEQRLIKLKISKQAHGQYFIDPVFDYKLVEKYQKDELEDMVRNKPTYVKRREINDKPIDVFIRAFQYSGGVTLLYQNRISKHSYIQEMTLNMKNLRLEEEKLLDGNTVNLELAPHAQKVLSFVSIDNSIPFVFKTKISYYLGTPEFQF